MKKIKLLFVFIIGMMVLQSYGQDTLLLSKGYYAVITKTGTTYFNTYTKSELDSIDKVNCLKFDREIDEFTGEVTIRYEVNSDITFLKIIKNKISTYYLSLYIKESSPYIGRGVTLLICTADTINNIWINKYKINRPNELVDYTYIGTNFYTRAFIKLSIADLELIKKGEYIKYQLYVSNDSGGYQSDRIKCLIKSK